jgi:hypothetical protein
MLVERARKKRRKSPQRKSQDRQSESSDKDEDFPVINVRWLYVFFLSARNLHVPAAFCLALASSVGLSTLNMTFGTPYATAVIVPLLAGVCLEIAWFCSVRLGPAVVASAPYGINYFLPAVGRYPSYPESSSKKHKKFRKNSDTAMIFPSVYVAHTGCFDKAGFPICVQSAAPLQQHRWPQVLRAVSARAGAARWGRLGAARAAPRARAAGAAPTGWRGTNGRKRSNLERRARQVRRPCGAAAMPGHCRGRVAGSTPAPPPARRPARWSVP